MGDLDYAEVLAGHNAFELETHTYTHIMVGGSVAESVDNKIMLCALAHSSFAVERTLGTTRQVLNRQLFSSGQDLQIVIVFICLHAYCHCHCILSSITYIHLH